MIAVLGLPLETARGRLEKAGYRVAAVEVRSKKGLEGSDCRVIAVRETAENEAELQYARFITDVSEG